MRCLFPLLSLIVLSTSCDMGFAQTHELVLPKVRWKLSKVAKNLGIDRNALLFVREAPDTSQKEYVENLPNPTTLRTMCMGSMFGREGKYMLGFNDDSLLTEIAWLQKLGPTDSPHEIFNSLRESFLNHGYELKPGTNGFPATPSDIWRSIAFDDGSIGLGSTRYVLEYGNNSIAVRGFANVVVQNGLRYQPPALGWDMAAVAKHFGSVLERAVFEQSEIDSNTVYLATFMERFCDQKGMYAIGFNKDTLVSSYLWVSDTVRAYQTYNTLITCLQEHGLKPTNPEDVLYAKASDESHYIVLNFVSTTVALQLSESRVYARIIDADDY